MPTSYTREEYENLFGPLSSRTGVETAQSGWGDRTGAAFDRAKSDLYEVGEVLGLDTEEARREAQFRGEVNRNKAVRDTGAPARLGDIGSMSDLAKATAGLFVDSSPELVASLASGGAGAALRLGTAGRTALLVGTQYPLAMGDILSNQREQSGRTDGASAAALAVPYAAADALFGVDAALGRAALNNTGKVMDAIGVSGTKARYAGGVGINALAEGGNEVFQEGMNQLGRMAVDPNQDFLDAKSKENFTESFFGGALMGGTMGLAGSGKGRSPHAVRGDLGAAPAADSEAAAINKTPIVERPAFDLESYDAETTGPSAPARPAPVEVGSYDPDQIDMFDSQGQPTYAADPSFSFEEMPPPMPKGASPTTSLGARESGVSYDNGIDYAPETAPAQFDTGGLTLRAPTDAATPDMFGGPARTAADMAPPPAPFELTQPDAGNPNQMELPLSPPAPAPTMPMTATGGQRGVTGQLPFSANTTSPKGQVMQGMLESLAAEGHIDDGDLTQLGTLIAQGKFAAAKKSIDAAMAEKKAADSLVAKAEKLSEQQNGQQGQAATGSGAQASSAPRGERPAVADGGRAVRSAGRDGRPVGVSDGAPAMGVDRPGDGVSAGPVPGDGRAVPGRQVPADAGRGGVDSPVRVGAAREHAALTDAGLIDRVESAKTDEEYNSLLDEMYERWLESDIGEVSDFVENNSRIKSFAREWAATEARYDAKAREGRKGLRMGHTPASDSVVDSETDSILRDMSRPFASTAEMRDEFDSDYITDPDRTTAAAIPQEVSATWRTASDALQYFRTKGSSPFARYLSSVLAPHVRDVPITFLTPKGTAALSPKLREMMETSNALYFRTPDGHHEILVRTDRGNEVNVLHEILHAATINAMDPRLNPGKDAEFRKLARNVTKSLRTMLDNMELNPAEENALAYFAQLIEDPVNGVYEYVAYTMSSPTFRALSQRLNADGTLKPDAMTPSSASRPSLFQRFVDAVLSLFGIQRAYQKSLLDLVNSNDSTPLLDRNIEALRSVIESSSNRTLADIANGVGRGDAKASTASAKRTDAEIDRMASLVDSTKLAGNSLWEKVKAAAFNARESRPLLPTLTNDQIAESYKNVKGLVAMNRATGRMSRVANNHMEMTSQVAKKWSALVARNEAAALEMQKLMLETTMAGGHVSIKKDGRWLTADEAFKDESNNHLTKDDRAKFDELHARFMKLPAEARNVYDAVRDDLANKHREMIDSLEKSIVRQHADKIGDVTALLAKGDAYSALDTLAKTAKSDEAKRAIAAARRAVGDVRSEMGTVAGPYFPLTRFGDHVVVVRSSDMTAALQAESSARDALQAATFALEDAAESAKPAMELRVEEAKAALDEARKQVEKFKQNGEHYEVSFHETAYQARKHFEQQRDAHPDGEVYETKREEYMRGLDGASPAFMRTMQDTLDAALRAGGDVDAGTRQRVMEAANDLYLRRSPERSALRNELRRMNIEGVKAAEMLRGYVHTARGNAWRISRLKHADEVVAGMGELAADKSPEARDVLNEMKRRFAGDYAVPNDNRLVNALAGATYFMHLGFNASYMLMNMTQAWVVSLPMLAGRHGGMLRAGQELAAASKEVVAGLRNATAESIQENGVVVGLQLRLTDEQIDAMGKTEGERQMLRALTADGVIDITIKHDLGAMTDGAGGPVSKAVELSSALANFTELYNRLSTALAAYRMEVARHGSQADAQTKATEYAEHILNRTHFNYAPENAPRIMRGNIGRLVFQFKRYTQGMIYLFASLVKQAYKGDRDAQKALFYTLGTHWAVAGTAGLPVAAPISLAAQIISSMFPDDDEPELLQEVYNGIKDAIGEDAARVLVKGLPTLTGADLSGKIGAGDLLNPAGFARTGGKETGSQDWMAAVFFALAGPGVGQVAKQGEALRAFADGKVAEGVEKSMPTFLSAPMRAWREASDGVTNKRGETLIDPSEFGWGDVPMKALGFQTVKTSDMYGERSAYMEMVKNRKDTRTKLMGDYYKAMKDKDPEAVAEARQAISGFNKRQPADAITPRSLRQGLEGKSRGEMRGGLRVTDRDEDTYRRLKEGE